ncbi:hypothetical protein ACJX0J_013935 [Zea mays]
MIWHSVIFSAIAKPQQAQLKDGTGISIDLLQVLMIYVGVQSSAEAVEPLIRRNDSGWTSCLLWFLAKVFGWLALPVSLGAICGVQHIVSDGIVIVDVYFY